MSSVPFPEIGSSTDPKQAPWADAIVWSERSEGGQRVYEWLTKEHIRSASWDKGTVSIQLAPDSFLADSMLYLLISAPFIAVGKRVPLG